jgi:hypothetical protein
MVHEILSAVCIELCKEAAKKAYSCRPRPFRVPRTDIVPKPLSCHTMELSPKPTPGIITYYEGLAG